MSLTIPFWELREPPKMAEDARLLLARRHTRRDWIWPEEDGEPVRLDPPMCDGCNEPWGPFGCPTMLALATLATMEHDLAEATKKVAALTEAVNALSVNGSWWRAQDRQQAVVTLTVEEIALRLGGVGVIEATLRKLYEQMKVFVDELPARRSPAPPEETPKA